MKNFFSKIMSILLVLIMAVSVIPMSSFNASAVTYGGDCGTNVRWRQESGTDVLTIKGTGNMRNGSFYPSSLEKREIKTIIIEEGVESIGDAAFSGFSNIKSITIPDSVTSIGGSAFSGCSSLESITIPKSVISIGSNAFFDCISLKSITVPENVTVIPSRMMDNCKNLETVIIKGNITSIGGDAFSQCYNLKSINLPASLELIESYAFWDCISLESITLPDGLTEIEQSVFYNCASLKNITIPKNLSTISDKTFYSCESLEFIAVDKENSHFTNDEYGVLFNASKTILYCYPPANKSTEYKIPDTVTEIKTYAFDRTNNLETLRTSINLQTINWRGICDCGSLKRLDLFEKYTAGLGNNIVLVTDPIIHYSGAKENLKATTSQYSSPVIHYTTKYKGEDATCTKSGYTNSVYCDICKLWITTAETIPATKHSHISEITIPATHISTGVMTYTCDCGDTYTETIAKTTEHSHNAVVTDPTCTEQGYTTYTCECGDTYIADYVDATGHSHTAEVTTPATHTATGVMTYTCACGDTYTETIGKIAEHSHNAVVTAPTCTAQGYTTYTCKCGDSYVDDYVPEKGHDEGIWSVTKPSTPIESGVMHLFCGECGFVLETKVIPALGKVNSVSVSDVALDYKASTTITPSIVVDSGVKYTVTYSSSDPSVASIDANGKVVAGKTGSATITVTVTDEFGNTVSDTCKVNVSYNWWQWILVIVLFGWIWY